MTISDARQWLRDKLKRGIKCPVCDKYCQSYKYSINAGMAKFLLKLYRAAPDGRTVHIRELIYSDSKASTNGSHLKWWGLLLNNKPGHYSITNLGIDFITGKVDMPRSFLSYNNKPLKWSDERITFANALSEPLNLADIIYGDLGK